MNDNKIEGLKFQCDKYIKLMDTKKFDEINSNEIYIQKWYALYMINKKNIIDNSTLYKYYGDTFGINLK